MAVPRMNLYTLMNIIIICSYILSISYVVDTLALPADKISTTDDHRSTLKLDAKLLNEETSYENRNADTFTRKKRQLNTIQTKIVNIVQPKPIVDTLKEEEKVGNVVDHSFGKSVVKAIERLSQLINSAFTFPAQTVKKVSRTATEALNNFGSRLVGLQK